MHAVHYIIGYLISKFAKIILTGLTDVFCSRLIGLILIGGLGLPTKEGKVAAK